MRRRDWFYLLSGLLLITVFIGWLYQPIATPVPRTSVTIVTNTAAGSVFRLKNDGAEDVFMSRLIVETNFHAGWITACFSNWTTISPVVFAKTYKDLALPVPDGIGAWRLRVVYGVQVRGPNLMVAKAAFALSKHKWPGKGFAMYVGSNSVYSPQINR